MFVEVKPIFDIKVRELCFKPYPLHKNGCPNYNKKMGCPPKAPLIFDVLNLDQKVYAIYNIFDIGFHVEKMRKLHPKWSDRQLKCCLYWQSKARKELKVKIIEFLREFPKYYVVNNPEAQGVNLTETMKNVGIILEWPPEKLAYQIVLSGIKKEKENEKS
jgi:predicted metal-binding protein